MSDSKQNGSGDVNERRDDNAASKDTRKADAFIEEAKKLFTESTLERRRLITVSYIPSGWYTIIKFWNDKITHLIEADSANDPTKVSYHLCSACNLIFPKGHPIDNVIYARHPVAHEQTALHYYPFDQFHKFIFEEKLFQAVELLHELGASKMELRQQGKEKTSSDKNVGAHVGGAEASVTKFEEVRADSELSFSCDVRNAMVLGHDQIPSDDDLFKKYPWYQTEKSWQAVVRARRRDHYGKFKIAISYTDDFGINKELRAQFSGDYKKLSNKFTTTETYVSAIECEFIEQADIPQISGDEVQSHISNILNDLRQTAQSVTTIATSSFSRLEETSIAINDSNVTFQSLSKSLEKSLHDLREVAAKAPSTEQNMPNQEDLAVEKNGNRSTTLTVLSCLVSLFIGLELGRYFGNLIGIN